VLAELWLRVHETPAEVGESSLRTEERKRLLALLLSNVRGLRRAIVDADVGGVALTLGEYTVRSLAEIGPRHVAHRHVGEALLPSARRDRGYRAIRLVEVDVGVGEIVRTEPSGEHDRGARHARLTRVVERAGQCHRDARSANAHGALASHRGFPCDDVARNGGT